MNSSYSRLGYGALKKESTENTAVVPDTFFGLTGEDILVKWGVKPSANIFADRNIRINPIKNAVDAPMGKISLMIEGKKFGHFLRGVFGAPSTGRYFPIFIRLSTGSVTGTPAAGATLSQATSGATATVATVVDATHLDVRGITVGFDATHLVTGTNLDGTTFTFTPSATLPVPAWTVGETITGASSSSTATVVIASNEQDYLLVSSPSAGFTSGEGISGGSSSSKATLGVVDNTVYGHEFKGPQNSLDTYCLEIGYQNEAVRFCGVRFPDFKTIKDKDNIMVCEIGVFARSAFINARVTAVLAAGAGSKVILVDQTQGLVAGDSIKVFRPSTGLYLDFSASSVKTHSIGSLSAEASITVTNLQTALAVGDLIVLAPQTPSYSVAKEFPWIGGTVGRCADSITAAITAAAAGMENSDFQVTNETESVHAANATTVAGRFPTANFIKAFKAAGKFKAFFQDSTFVDRLRNSTPTGIQIRSTGPVIGSTLLNYLLDWRYASCVATAFVPPMQEDNILSQEIPWEMFKSSADGYTAKALLVSDTTSF